MARTNPGRAFLYCITNNLNGKRYIGIASDPEERWRRHLGEITKTKIRQSIHQAIAKHGQDAFTFSIIASSPTWADGLATERALIIQYDTKRNGYNSTDGGEGVTGRSHTEASRLLMSAKAKGRKASEETRKKLSAMRAGRVRGSMPEEWRAKISATMTGKKIGPPSEAHRAALSASQKGQKRGPLSEAHRALLSKIRTGKKRPPMSEEWRAAIAAAQRGKKRGSPSEEVWVKRREGLLAYHRRRKETMDADITAGAS